MLIRIERDEIVDVYTEVGGPCGRQPPLFYGLVGSIGVIGDDVIRLLVLIERGSWKNLRKKEKISSNSLGGLENSPYLRFWKS